MACTLRTIFLVLLLFSLPCQSWAQDKRSVPEQRLLYRAQQALDKDEVDKAREILSFYLADHPETSDPLFFQMLGNACFQTEDLPGAARWYAAGLSKHPENLILCRNLAAARYGLKDYHKAGKLFETSYRLTDPKEPELLYQAGISWYQAEQFKHCRAVLEQLFEATPVHKKSWMQLMIQVCYEQQAFARAETLLKEFLEICPLEKEYWKLLSTIQTESRNYKAAAASLSMALSLDTTTSEEWEQLASLYFYLNAPLQGIRCLEKAAGSTPTLKQHDTLAQRYTQVHRYADALRHLDKAISKDPIPARMIARAKILFAERKFDQAHQSLAQALQKNPDLTEASLLMGYCAIEQQKWQEADAVLSTIKKGTYLLRAQNALQSIAPFLEEQ